MLATQPQQSAGSSSSGQGGASTRNTTTAAANCTPPRTAEDASKPFCFVPDTISPEAQAFLSNASSAAFQAALGGSEDPSQFKNETASETTRRFFNDAYRNESAAAVAQFLQGTENGTIAGVPVVYGTPKGFDSAAQGNKLLIYLHGGAYILGSCHIQWATVAQVAQDSGLRVLCIEYRLAPEHPFPAGLHDALAVYKDLVGKQGYDATNIVLLGDSAGGGLALALVIQLQREGIALPAALGLFSPWVELDKRGDTLTTLIAVDPILLIPDQQPTGGWPYLGGKDSLLSDPLVSPLRADYGAFNGTFPHTLIQLGLRDSFLSDSVLLYRKLKAAAAGVCPTQRVVFSPWEAMWHVFQGSLYLPEAREASAEMAAFFVSSLNGSQQC